MEIIFETERLLFRKFNPSDGPLLYELNRDPEVTRYTLDPMVDVEHAQKILKETIIPQYELNNYGRWSVHLKNGEFMGWCGLKSLPETQEIDLGYRFMRKFWGLGYATEAAKATLDHGFNVLELSRIIGRSLPGNKASIRVLEKCGMHWLKEEVVGGLLHQTYELKNPNILS